MATTETYPPRDPAPKGATFERTGEFREPHDEGTLVTLVDVAPDGSLRFVGDLPTETLGEATRERASRILPVHPIKRAAFRMLRALAPDDGRIAAWTRQWRGPWQATILSTGETHVAKERSACIAWEVQVLEGRL